jgi:hypothetical protein
MGEKKTTVISYGSRENHKHASLLFVVEGRSNNGVIKPIIICTDKKIK